MLSTEQRTLAFQGNSHLSFIKYSFLKASMMCPDCVLVKVNRTHIAYFLPSKHNSFCNEYPPKF